MYEAIKNFNQQFLFEPKIINEENFIQKSSFVVVGMGGSALAALLLKTWKPKLNITIRRDYGLPEFYPEELKNKLIILSSYSGNTEEVIDAFKEAQNKNLAMAVISIGGKLLELAKENNVPYIKLPDTGIQPRSALGFSIKAFLKFIGEEEELKKLTELATVLNPIDFEKEGKILAEKIRNHIPVIYASDRNLSVAYNWKIKLNESGKIPAFYNVFPELNHNEINGFNVKDSTRELNNKFYFIFLKDTEDDPRILKRMEVTEKLYQDRNLPTRTLELTGENIWFKIFSSLVLADWAAYYTALQYGLDPQQIPMVENFKKLILE
ncbi:MAG: bifunctional phosphoglucose/phosphomannose isomerase [Patescibacteria group bacterium]